MLRHDTPKEVAAYLARYAPPHAESILEPSVGKGHLLYPILLPVNDTIKRVVCIDTDTDILNEVAEKFGPLYQEKLEIVNEDFLAWSALPRLEQGSGFDCIVMNPPFSGKTKNWIKLDLGKELGKGDEKSCAMPLEAAFILRALNLLNPKGKLLAVVPSTLVSSLRTTWLRKYMLELGAVTYVHELPKKTFIGVESRVYLFVFERSQIHSKVMVLNHDLSYPVRMKINKKDLANNSFRFDYSFHHSFEIYKKNRILLKDLNWGKLKDVAIIKRGEVDSPKGYKDVLHSCDFRNGFWELTNSIKNLPPIMNKSIFMTLHGDLIVKRVGRNCSSSFGVNINRKKIVCSDCLLIIRPKEANMSVELLFALRIMFSEGSGFKLIERGTGATYIAQQELMEFLIPLNLSDFFPDLFIDYRKAIKMKQYASMKILEEKSRQRLMRLSSDLIP